MERFIDQKIKSPDVLTGTEKAFQSYMNYFPLTEEDLKKPLLDVGAGNNRFIQYVREKFGNEQAYGIEVQQRKIISQNKDGSAVAGSGLELPFKDGSFEVVIAKNYLPMFVDDEIKMERSIGELLRVSKSGAKIMGDISIPEKELGARDLEENEKTKAWLNSRYEGSKKFVKFLETLKEEGFSVIFKETPSPHKKIMIIQKP